MCSILENYEIQLLRFIAAILICVSPFNLLGQEKENTQDSLEVVQIESIALTSMSSEAERTSLELKKKKAILLDYEIARRIRKDAAKLRIKFEDLKARSDSMHLAMSTQNGLRDLRLKWMRLEEQLGSWQSSLGEQTVVLEEALSEINDLKQQWTITKEEALSDSVPETIVDRIDVELSEIEVVRIAMRDTLSTYVVGMDMIVQHLLDIREYIEQIRIVEERTWSALFSKDSPAIWEKTVGQRSQPGVTTKGVGVPYLDVLGDAKSFVKESSAQLWKHSIVFFIILGLTFYLFTRSGKLPVEVKDELGPAFHLIRRPISIALLLALLAFPVLYNNPPIIVEEAFIFLLMIPLMIIVPVMIDKRLKLPFFIMVGLFVLDEFQMMNARDLTAQRALLFAENLIGLGALLWFFRAGGPLMEINYTKLGRAVHKMVPAIIILIALSLLANVSGRVSLSRVLTIAMVQSAMAGVILFAGLNITKGILIFLLRFTPIKDLNISLKYSDKILRGSIRLLHTFAMIWWISILLEQFSIWEPFKLWVIEVATNEWSYGTTSISIWNILQFFIVIIFSILLANLLRVLLEEEVLVRFKLGRGMPMSIAFIVKYTVLVVGFFLAVGAAGLDLDRFGVLAGALGVGIGFGLQGLVANFISGVILVFERPIHVGDVVELGQGGLQGTVTAIGVRASNVRTWDGAEVIVPNGDLITKQVTNWTLSDAQRRREVKISTALNADPDQVLEIMRKVAGLHPDVITEPEPAAYFLGYTEHTLDFRLLFWVTQNLLRSSSDVALGIYAELKAAGIEVPVERRSIEMKNSPPSE